MLADARRERGPGEHIGDRHVHQLRDPEREDRAHLGSARGDLDARAVRVGQRLLKGRPVPEPRA